MSEAKRLKLSPVHSCEMWCRWKAGQSQHEIGRALGRAHSSIHLWLLTHEMAEDKAFTVATDVKVYFCDPQSP